MNKKTITIPYIISIVSQISYYTFHLQPIVIYLSLILLCFTVIIAIFDASTNKIYNKQFWILSLLLLSIIAIPLYLLRRESLIRLGEKFGTKGYHNSNFSNNG